MLSSEKINKKIGQALALDVSTNPRVALDFDSKEDFLRAISADAENAMKGDQGIVLFPHLRTAIQEIMGNAKYERWMQTGQYLGYTPSISTTTIAQPASVAAAQSSGTDWLSFAGDITKALVSAGATIYGAKQQAELAEKQAKAQQAQALALQQAAAAQAATANRSQASMFGMSPNTLLLIGAGAAGVYMMSQQKGGGGGRRRSSGRRSTRRRSTRRRRR